VTIVQRAAKKVTTFVGKQHSPVPRPGTTNKHVRHATRHHRRRHANMSGTRPQTRNPAVLAYDLRKRLLNESAQWALLRDELHPNSCTECAGTTNELLLRSKAPSERGQAHRRPRSPVYTSTPPNCSRCPTPPPQPCHLHREQRYRRPESFQRPKNGLRPVREVRPRLERRRRPNQRRPESTRHPDPSRGKRAQWSVGSGEDRLCPQPGESATRPDARRARDPNPCRYSPRASAHSGKELIGDSGRASRTLSAERYRLQLAPIVHLYPSSPIHLGSH